MTEDLRLKVMASSIGGKGIAKLDSDSFRILKLSDGTPIIVTYGTKSRELSAKQDNIFSESTARLMKDDMEYLRVEEGMMVTVAIKNGSVKKKTKEPAKKARGKKKSKANAASLDSF
ncbi:MAG: hypothetical protein Q7J68_03640 [Thermoplasmata archaeon]|nr:hypothetical protein [Thermoplasmata archaeon]